MLEQQAAPLDVIGSGASNWIERLRLDHRRARALLKLITEQLDAEGDLVLEHALIVRDVMTYMRDFFDPAHHGIEESLFAGVRGMDAGFDGQVELLNEQHEHAFDESRGLLKLLDTAIADDEFSSYSEALQQAADYCERMAVHLEYEERFVFPRLEELLRDTDPVALPPATDDPVFGDQTSEQYAELYEHFLYRVNKMRSRNSWLDALPLAPIPEAIGLVSEQVAGFSTLLRSQRQERMDACRGHLSLLRGERWTRKPLVLVGAFGEETARTFRQRRELLRQLSRNLREITEALSDLADYMRRHTRRTRRTMQRGFRSIRPQARKAGS